MQFARLYKAILASAILPILLMGQTTPPKVTRTETAQVEVPFSATLPPEARAGILKVLFPSTYKLNGTWAAKSLREQLVAQRGVIEAQDAKYFAQLDAHLAELLASAQKIIDQEMRANVAESYQKATELLISDLEKDAPSLLITGVYQYEAPKRDLGEPGWKNPPQAELRAGHTWQRQGQAELNKDIELAVPGAKVSLAVKVQAKFTLSTRYEAIGLNARDVDMPETHASAEPLLVTKAEMNIASANESVGGSGCLTALGCTWQSPFSRVQGTLRADPKTAK